MQPSSVDILTSVLGLLGCVFAIIRGVGTYYIDKRVKDAQMRSVLENALNNGLGIIQQVASGTAAARGGHLPVNISPRLAPGVQYVLDHAAPALARWGITPQAIEQKLIARAGLKEIETNLAATASSATANIIAPLAPTEPVTARQEPRTDAPPLAPAIIR